MSNTNNNMQPQTSSVLQNDTASLCSTSKVQEKTQLSRIKCTEQEGLSSNSFTTQVSHRNVYKILTDCKTTLTKLRTTFENAFSSEIKAQDSNSETASSKLVKECSLNSETKDVHAIKYKMSKAKERCMTYFHSLHSHLQVLSKDDLKGTRIEHGFKRAFMSLLRSVVDTFTRTMLSTQMTDTYFVEYTGIEVQHFRDTLLQHLGNVKKSIAERTRQQHTEQPEIIIEGRVDQYPETCQVKSLMLDSSPDNQTTEYLK
ncbi:hypothetical protein Tco_1081976 [Tanacetum coccineum]|uniref:Uncharacterized protein n=1 Tax=Tanacetum coccineum TaxID=301880 RepID=A0ABQ5I086_9ASTR